MSVFIPEIYSISSYTIGINKVLDYSSSYNFFILLIFSEIYSLLDTVNAGLQRRDTLTCTI